MLITVLLCCEDDQEGHVQVILRYIKELLCRLDFLIPNLSKRFLTLGNELEDLSSA